MRSTIARLLRRAANRLDPAPTAWKHIVRVKGTDEVWHLYVDGKRVA